METALRRQVGVDAVDIDTRLSTCSIAYGAPTPVDFGAVDSAAKDAAYELTSMVLHAEGEVVQQHCADCGELALFLVMPTTGQQFELGFDVELGPAQIVAEIDNWDTPHPVFQIAR